MENSSESFWALWSGTELIELAESAPLSEVKKVDNVLMLLHEPEAVPKVSMPKSSVALQPTPQIQIDVKIHSL